MATGENPSLDSHSLASQLVEACGTEGRAVQACAMLDRLVWEALFPMQGSGAVPSAKGDRKAFSVELLSLHSAWQAAGFELRSLDVLSALMRGLGAAPSPEGSGESTLVQVPRELLYSPISLARALLAPLEPAEHVLRYHVVQSIRRHYGVVRSEELPAVFARLAQSLHSVLAESNNPSGLVHGGTLDWAPTVRDPLLRKLTGTPWQASSDRRVQLFIECCRIAGYVVPGFTLNQLRWITAEIDSEYLMTRLFGFPSGIDGLDQLFGGGIALAEANSTPSIGPQHPDTRASGVSGRAVLIRGRYGTGKTLLGSQLAASVVEKGGLAWIMALEQPASEYKYALASFGLLKPNVSVATDPEGAARMMEKPEQGGLVILASARDSFEKFLTLFRLAGTMPSKHSLRLLCVDPVNSVCRQDGPDAEQTPVTLQRKQFLDAILDVKSSGTNIVLLSEEGADALTQSSFEENIVDTVVHLTQVVQHDYSRRYIEITKSRLQREQRGRHPYAIRPARGFYVFPSSAAVDARIRTRRTLPADRSTRFGLGELDDVLGSDAIVQGDVVVLDGAGGPYKTRLGMMFLAQSEPRMHHEDESGEFGALLFTPRESRGVLRQMLDSAWFRAHCQRERERASDKADGRRGRIDGKKRVQVCTLPFGHVHPAVILNLIEEQFEQAVLEKRRIDRVMVDSLAHWELSCPSVRDDETFADTLVNLLQRRQVTSLLVCGDAGLEPPGSVQRPILDRADCLIGFERFQFRGQARTLLRVRKSRSMAHERELYEIMVDEEQVRLNPTASLLRMSGNEIRRVPVRLFLHAESEAQYQYNLRLEAMIKSVLSPETTVEPQGRLYVDLAANLGNVSAIDELQIVQIDEYQLPHAAEASGVHAPLHIFSRSQWQESGGANWNDFIPRLAEAVRSQRDGAGERDEVFAVPFHADVALIAHVRDRLSPTVASLLGESDTNPRDFWRQLASECARWEQTKLAEEDDRALGRLRETGGFESGRATSVGPPPGSELPPSVPGAIRSVFELGDQPGEPELFFEYSHVSSENYNCLFLEILVAFVAPPAAATRPGPHEPNDDTCWLLHWLNPDAPGIVEATLVFWRLCHAAHQLDLKRQTSAPKETLRPHAAAEPHFEVERAETNADTSRGEPFRVSTRAIVWRHWYSTLNQMLSRMPIEERARVDVNALPGRSVAGEWYMAIPSYSAAPKVGVSLIRRLTTRQANIERLHAGVGLPTLSSFYSGAMRKQRVSPYFSLDLSALEKSVTTALPRSHFGCYADYRHILAHHLKWLLELRPSTPGIGSADSVYRSPPEAELKERIQQMLAEVSAELRFAREPSACTRCKARTDGKRPKSTPPGPAGES